MSLMNDPKAVRAILRGEWTKGSVHTGYKLYRVRNGQLYPLFFDCTPVTVTRAGYIYGDKKTAKRPQLRRRYVHHGIHVYTSQAAIADYHTLQGPDTVVVEVWTNPRDIVAADPATGRATFRKVQIPRHERVRLEKDYGVKL